MPQDPIQNLAFLIEVAVRAHGAEELFKLIPADIQTRVRIYLDNLLLS